MHYFTRAAKTLRFFRVFRGLYFYPFNYTPCNIFAFIRVHSWFNKLTDPLLFAGGFLFFNRRVDSVDQLLLHLQIVPQHFPGGIAPLPQLGTIKR